MSPLRPARQTRRGSVAAIFLALSFPAGMARAQAPEENPAAPSNNASSANSKGTGIVPSGVKLVPDEPASAPPKEFHFPQAATKTLSNGLRVFVVTDHSEPAVAASLVILSAGSIEDPKGIPGVAKMTAGLLTQGTEKRTAQQIAETIDFVGGSLDASAGKDSTGVTLNIVKKDLATGLDLMADVVLHPAFQADELERQRQQLLSGLTVQYSDPEYLASAAFTRTVYEGSAYGWPDDGTPDSAKAFTRDLFVKFHDANYAPNTSLLAFAGDIDPDEAFAAAEKYFGGWARQPIAMTASAAPNPMNGVHVWLIDKPDAVQTQIRVGKLGISRSDPNYIPVVVMNRIFGGGYNSRLNTEVRVKKGLTYGAYSSFDPHRYAGTFSVSTFTRTAATVQATRLAVDLIAQMAKGDVMPKELDFSRDYLAGVYPIQSETAEQVANRVLTVAAFDLPADYNSTYPDRIRSVSVDQVDQMAKKYLQSGDLDIVLAGNVGAFRDELKKAFPDAQYQEVRFDQLDLLAPGLRRAQP
jgi:zinc protease